MQIAVLGIDLGKNSCSVAALDSTGAVIKRRRMRPESIAAFTEKLPACIVAMEACCGAHHLGRVLAAQGHQVRLMSPEYVRPYVKAQKNDDRDAEAIAEAATRPTMRFVELKSESQLDMQTLHRARDRLVGERTALINQLRAVLLERGITVPQGRRKLEQHLEAMTVSDSDHSLSPRIRQLIDDMRAEWVELDRRIAAFDNEFAAYARSDAGRAAPSDDPRYRCVECNGIGRRDRRRPNLRSWTRSCGVAWAGATPDHDRRQAASGWHHQAWQQISAQAA